MTLTILSVAYPFAPVGPGTAGGAEQVLHRLDSALCAAGHRSIVIAREDSRICGSLIGMPAIAGLLDGPAMQRARARHRKAILDALQRWPVDVVHMHGVDFHTYLPPEGIPTLATLHLPLDHYPEAILRSRRRDLWFNCVSEQQALAAPRTGHVLAPIANGIDVGSFATNRRRRDFALILTRICPEKGIHLAIAAAAKAGMPLLIAGEVFPYEAHRRYFAEDVAPRLNARCRYLGPVGFRAKRVLLSAARCLLIPSLVEETSSLVAREAAAAGTAVIAFERGALPATVRHGETGFIVRTPDEMTAAMLRCHAIDPHLCRQHARRHFSAALMARRYLDLYRGLAVQRTDAFTDAAT